MGLKGRQSRAYPRSCGRAGATLRCARNAQQVAPPLQPERRQRGGEPHGNASCGHPQKKFGSFSFPRSARTPTAFIGTGTSSTADFKMRGHHETRGCSGKCSIIPGHLRDSGAMEAGDIPGHTSSAFWSYCPTFRKRHKARIAYKSIPTDQKCVHSDRARMPALW